MSDAIAVPPADGLGINSIILFGADRDTFDEKVRRDRRIRFVTKTHLNILGRLGNVQVVVWYVDPDDEETLAKVQEALKALRDDKSPGMIDHQITSEIQFHKKLEEVLEHFSAT
jgi:hypothetical protein